MLPILSMIAIFARRYRCPCLRLEQDESAPRHAPIRDRAAQCAARSRIALALNIGNDVRARTRNFYDCR